MGTEIKELYSALQRFIDRKQKMHIPLEQDDDDVIIAGAFNELEQLREENKRLREELRSIISDFNTSRPLSMGGIDTHRSVTYSHEKIQRLKILLEGGDE